MSRIVFWTKVKTGKRSFQVAPSSLVAKTLGLMSAINSSELELYTPAGQMIEPDDSTVGRHERTWGKHFEFQTSESGVEYEVRKRSEEVSSSSAAAAAAAAAAGDRWHRACTVAELQAADKQRIRMEIEGRDVLVWRLKDGGGPGVDYGCIDAVCYHFGGPLDLGDIEELMGDACVVCPWHRYPISLRTGESMTRAQGPSQPCKSKGRKQRVHHVKLLPATDASNQQETADDVVCVQLNRDPDDLPSDVYAGMGLLHETRQLKPPPRVHSSMKKQ